MAIRRDDLERSLALQDADALRLILDAAGVSPRGATDARGLAARLVDAIWWNHSTPLGYLAERASFEDVVTHLARKLGVADRVDPDQDGWEQVAALTAALVREVPAHGITLEDLDDSTRARMRPAWLPPVGFGVGAGSSFATRWGAGKVLNLLQSPIGRLLPWVPGVGPWVGPVRTGLSAVHLVAGPLGVALSVLSLNSALGANYARLVPLVLGVGALRPRAVEEAQEVPAAPGPEPIEA